MTGLFVGAPLPTLTPDRGRAGVADGIAAWLDSAAMTTLLEAFGYRLSPGGSLADRLNEIERFSERWNYRQGMERHEAVGEEFPPEFNAVIRATTAALGLADCEAPPAAEYDHVLVLGGGVRTMLARSRLAASLLRSGVTAQTVAGLGSMRPLAGQEETARQFGLAPCPTEGDAVDATLRREFALKEPTERRAGLDWWVRSYHDSDPVVHVLAASSTRAGMRANTADTFIGWAKLLPLDPQGARLLMITTDMFVPFQHCDAVRVLGLRYDAVIDTVGFATATNPWVPTAQTFEVLQEVRAAIHSMQRLYAAVA